MNNSEQNTKRIILEAAEAEFLEKGFGNAKMMAIARRANVVHSMLHYYFKSKENLFQTVLLMKSQAVMPLFEGALDRQLPFADAVRIIIETQFGFMKQNPKLPLFLLVEIISNKKNRELLMDVLSEKAWPVVNKLKRLLEEEISKGNVRPIQFHNFLINIVALNATTFLALPVLQGVAGQANEPVDSLLNERMESNIQFVLAAMRP